MSIRYASLPAASALLAAALTFPACDGAEPLGSSVDPLRNGTGVNVPQRGAVEIVSQVDGSVCSGVLIKPEIILSTVRCLSKFVPAGRIDVIQEPLPLDVYLWHYDLSTQKYIKHCISQPHGVTDDNNGGAATCWPVPNPATNKARTIHLYRGAPLASGNVDDDIAILTSGAWREPDGFVHPYEFWRTTPSDWADIYMDDFTPTSLPRLQLASWGSTGKTSAGAMTPSGLLRVGTMAVKAVTAAHVDTVADQIQTCAGDEGGPWSIPSTAPNDQNAVVGLQSIFPTVSSTSNCAYTNSTNKVVRIKDKMAWIENWIGACVDTTNLAGHHVKRCYEKFSCDGLQPNDYAYDPALVWDGCRGSGCAVCAEKVSAYPLYFRNHPACVKNTTCGGSFYNCSINCPPPTDVDKLICTATPAGDVRAWNGCKSGSGCSACGNLLTAYPNYFKNNPYCTKTATCSTVGACSPNCPAPTELDR